MKDEGSRFLIVRTDRLGDVVLTLPMARVIKEQFPSAHVLFLVRNYTRPIVERCPDVDSIMTLDATKSIVEQIGLFRGARADAVFFPSPRFRLALAAFLARVPKRVGTAYRWYSFLFNVRIKDHRKTAERHEAEYNMRMLSNIGFAADLKTFPSLTLLSSEEAAVRSWLRRELQEHARYAVLHIGSGGSAMEWPAAHFIELAKRLPKVLEIVLTGMNVERERLDAVQKSLPGAHLFIDHPLPELAALLKQASLVVSSSTGPGHLAAALGTPSIGLFPLRRVLSKERWGFRGPRATNLSPEPLRSCPNCEHCTCMERLTVETVVRHIPADVAERSPAIS